MKLLGLATFFLAVLCVCTVGDDGPTTSSSTASLSPSTPESATEAASASASQTTAQAPVLTTVPVRTTTGPVTNKPSFSSPTATQQVTQGTTTRPPVAVPTTAAAKSDSTAAPTQASGTQLAHSESLNASSTQGWSSTSQSSLQETTSTHGTSGPPGNWTSESPDPAVHHPGNSSGNRSEISSGGSPGSPGSDTPYSSVILPVVITMIAATLVAFSGAALYRLCQKKTPERQENGAEQAQSDKEGVKLLSVKTTSPETGEHSSQGKSKTRQFFTPQQ